LSAAGGADVGAGLLEEEAGDAAIEESDGAGDCPVGIGWPVPALDSSEGGGDAGDAAALFSTAVFCVAVASLVFFGAGESGTEGSGSSGRPVDVTAGGGSDGGAEFSDCAFSAG
jgi:hypothetical protein